MLNQAASTKRNGVDNNAVMMAKQKSIITKVIANNYNNQNA